MNNITLKPRMSEKSYGQSNDGVYVFDVDTRINKHEVSKAVEKIYGVTVINVRTNIRKGKPKRLYKNRRYENGRTSDIKLAYVTLKNGDAIPIFAAVEEAEEKAEKGAKLAKKAAEKKEKKEKRIK